MRGLIETLRLAKKLPAKDRVSGTFEAEKDLVWVSVKDGSGKANLDGTFTAADLRAILAFITPATQPATAADAAPRPSRLRPFWDEDDAMD